MLEREKRMVVAAAGKSKLLNLIFGIATVFLAVGFTLYLYSLNSTQSINGSDLIIKAADVPRLFLLIGMILFLGIVGGYEIGRFMESTKIRKAAFPRPMNAR
jgi:uncharacterized membrane protein YqhA